MSEEFSYLFFERNNKMIIVGVQGETFDILKENGIMEIDNDRETLIDFFKRKTGHFDETVDFCYISDQYDDTFLEAFTFCDKTSFDALKVKDLLDELYDDARILCDKDIVIIHDGQKAVYKSNIEFENMSKSDTKRIVEKKLNPSIENPNEIMSYYRNKTEEYLKS